MAILESAKAAKRSGLTQALGPISEISKVMSQQTCPECNTVAMTWALDDENITKWHCANCEFVATEDESQAHDCLACGGKQSRIQLATPAATFWWCLSCFSRR